jgi:hypothetical protein
LVGALIGLFVHLEDWQGGYASYRRRMMRLAHVACFALGMLNMLFTLTLSTLGMGPRWASVASWAFIAGVIAMPITCLLAAWRQGFRHLFPVPVTCVLVGIVCTLGGLL